MSDPILDLLAAPPSPSLSVDENAVYAGGRRRLRRRTLRRTGIGAVGVVGAAAVAFGALGQGVDREALPAGPSPSTSSSTSVTATLLDGRYAVEVLPGAGQDQPNVIFHAIENGTKVRLAASSATSDVVSLGAGSGADGVMLGTAPAGATMLQPVTERGGGLSLDQQPLPGTSYQAVALSFENPADVATYVDMVWVNAAGEVRDANGTRLPGTRLSATDTFFVLEQAGEMGVFTVDGARTKPLGQELTTTLGYGGKPEGGDWSWHSVTVLPDGSRDVSFEWADAEGRASDVTLRQVAGKVVAWADASAPGTSTGPRVTSVTWTDTEGTRHTEAAT